MPRPNRVPKQRAPQPDAELVEACLQGSEAAWAALFERYSGLIYSIPLRRGLGRDMADEVFQSVATTLIERLHVIQDPARLAKWLIVTTQRRCEMMLRRERRASEIAPPQSEPHHEDTESELVRLELRHEVAQALGQLRPRDREILTDLFERELSYAEVGRRHGLAIGSLGSRRARALARLRKILSRRGAL